jgi:hypothetical protein
MSLQLCPISISDACALVKRWHRHHQPPVSGLFAIGCGVEGSDEPCGCVIVGRPVARGNQDAWTCEVTRCCTDGTKNACSMLYRAAWRAARAMGYRRLITYTLASEGGVSLHAAGFKVVGEVSARSWSCPSRPRVDRQPLQAKIRWEVSA